MKKKLYVKAVRTGEHEMLLLIELIGALVLIGVCAYGASKLMEQWYNRNPPRNPPRKDPE